MPIRKKSLMLNALFCILLLCSCGTKEEYDFYYPIKDSEYLNIDDLSQLPLDDPNYREVSDNLKHFSGMIIKLRYNNKGQFPEYMNKYISEETLNKFKPTDDDALLDRNDVYVYFDSQIFDIKHNFERGIVSYGYNYCVCEYGSNKSIAGSHVDSIYPCKIYLEMKNGTWIVTDIFEGA